MNTPVKIGPEHYVNRELSLLEFNRRVIQQALVREFPLLERLRFICIASSNLDEFFEIRVAGIKQQIEYGSARTSSDGLSPEEQLQKVSAIVKELVSDQYSILNEVLTPKLREDGVYFLRREEWTTAQREWVQDYFRNELSPILNPIGLDPAHPFPRLLNKSLNFIATLKGEDAFGRQVEMAIVQAPRSLPRVIQFPEEIAEHENDFVFLSSIIHAHVDELFHGMEVESCYQFRVTRNSDLFVDEEEVTDLMQAIEGELSSRRFGDAVRLEVDNDCPEGVIQFLRRQFDLEQYEVYRCSGPVNLMRLNQIPSLVNRADLKFSSFNPGIPGLIQDSPDIFSAIRRHDLILHHPFQSFIPVLDLLRQAAVDPDVLSIRQTLYRTGEDSAVVKTLIDAASNGKEVLVVIELRARFDEAENIELANELSAAGAQVVFGMVGYKTHAKMILITRREDHSLRRYAHLGTGNYHAGTARQYTDMGLLTCDRHITEDVQLVFRQLTSMGHPGALRKVMQSPFTMFDRFVNLIGKEIEHAKAGKEARIVAKMNSLEEPGMIRKLFQASQAGVKIELIVRGVCCLRPGFPGVSENITVRSIIGRFLEHTRIYYFANDGDPRCFISSADWMGRNLFNRVETCVPIEDKDLANTVYKEGLEMYLSDNSQAWSMEPDGRYQQVQTQGDRASAQERLMQLMCR